MGYTTDFDGSLKFNKQVTEELKEYINRFSATRRMPRDNDKIKEIYPNWADFCFCRNLGNKGEYFAPISFDYGQEKDPSIIDYNAFRDHVQPSLWCNWVISEDGWYLEWNGAKKFYSYDDWLEYMIAKFFAPLGYVLNGDIHWQGEESTDFGTIHVVDNVIEMQYGIRVENMSDLSTEVLIAELEKRGYKVTA